MSAAAGKIPASSGWLSRLLPALLLVVSFAGLIIGCLSFFGDALGVFYLPVTLLLAVLLALFQVSVRIFHGVWSWRYILLFVLALLSVPIAALLPDYFFGFQINAIFSRGFVIGLLLLTITVPSLCAALFQFLGAGPRAHDISRYPLVVIPVLAVILAYGMVIGNIVAEGAPHLNWEVISQPFKWQHWQEVVYQNGWPTAQDFSAEQAGMRNHILGTLLLIGLTSVISLPIGMAAGIFISEYPRHRLTPVIRFSATVLRVISVFILGIAAYSLVRHSSGTFLSDIVSGFYYDAIGVKHVGHGSYLLASLFLSLLVIPLITRATEEGCASLPRDLREASLAVGASETYTLLHVTIPWSLPNVVTGLVLGCAEAAGSVAIILFLAQTGQFGVGPLNEVTSLSFFIWDCHYGAMTFRKVMEPFQYSGALLLLMITVALSASALLLKHRFGQRYRGL